MTAACGAARAQSQATDVPKTPSVEAWAGTEVFRKHWSLYTGATWAPLGSLDADGLRLRAVGGGGVARHRVTQEALPVVPGCNAASIILSCTSAPRGSPDSQRVSSDKRVATYFVEALAGYHWRTGDLTLKAFAGAAFVKRDALSLDAEPDWAGHRFGAKLAGEAWYNVTPKLWLATDLGFTTIERTLTARQRIGYRLFDQFSIGLDAALRGQQQPGAGSDSYITHRRAGLLLRYDWTGGEIGATVGWASDLERQDDQNRWSRPTPFAMLTLLMKF